MNLTENEEALYAELAVRLAFRMCGSSRYVEASFSSEKRSDFLGCIIEPGVTSDFQTACQALRDLGTLQPLDHDQSPREEGPVFAPCYRLKFGVSELRKRLVGALPASAPSLSELMAAFLGVVAGYNCDIHSRREAFNVPPDFERLFELFERRGYVERLGDKVKWTDKIAPEIRAAYEWTEDLISHAEAEEAALEKGWRTMPPRLRKALDTDPSMDYRKLLRVVRQFWNGSEWEGVNPEGGVVEDASDYECLTDQDIRMAQFLWKKFREAGN